MVQDEDPGAFPAVRATVVAGRKELGPWGGASEGRGGDRASLERLLQAITA